MVSHGESTRRTRLFGRLSEGRWGHDGVNLRAARAFCHVENTAPAQKRMTRGERSWHNLATLA